ncbi:MutS-related protein [Duganella aceris]|nr:DNA mismatch repair protein MutS [Duganella aceris]
MSLLALLLPADAPVADYPFVPADVALYHRTAHGADTDLIDAQTWDDMLLQPYSAQLAHETSIFGQQELHRRLQRGGRDAAASVVRVRALAADAGQLHLLHKTCEGLRRSDREISEHLFGPAAPAKPRWAALLHCMPPAFLLSAVLALVTGWLSLWGVVLALWLALMAVQVRFRDEAEEWGRVRNSMQQMLRTHSLLAKLDASPAAPLRADAARAGRINRAIGPSMMRHVPGAREYADWLWLQNIRDYFNGREAARRQMEFLRHSFRLVAALEADIALARHLTQTPRHCWAEQGADVALTQAVHPLLAQASPLSIALARQGALISGQNGIGKSTLLRTVGLNLIVARAFGFCYADRAVTPGLPVYSSMQSEDALEGGESLYIAELRRARELLALAARAPAIFIIDEIFRGTNHLESISAATAVLHTLSASGKVIVSSHNLVLAPLLADCLAPLCVSSVNGVLRVAPGVLKETNGITLLGARGFDQTISAKANRVYHWLSDYMAQPPDCAAIRADLHAELQATNITTDSTFM